jgi:hypothetical protein
VGDHSLPGPLHPDALLGQKGEVAGPELLLAPTCKAAKKIFIVEILDVFYVVDDEGVVEVEEPVLVGVLDLILIVHDEVGPLVEALLEPLVPIVVEIHVRHGGPSESRAAQKVAQLPYPGLLLREPLEALRALKRSCRCSSRKGVHAVGIHLPVPHLVAYTFARGVRVG